MPKRHLLPVVALLVIAGACAGTKVQVPPDAGATEIYALARAEQDQGRLASARDLYTRIVDDFPAAPEADEAEWLAAEMEYALGDLTDAKESYKSFHSVYPLENLGEIEDRMYSIGTQLHEGGQGGLLGLGIFTTSEDGISALLWITENLPNGARADDAYYFVATARMKDRQYEEAVIYFEEVVNRYPESEWAFRSRFLTGRANFLMNRGAAYDLGALLAARKDFLGYIREVERDPARKVEYASEIAEARDSLAQIDTRIAEKNVLIAKFYISRERFDAARLYLDMTVNDYRDTASGQEAVGLLETLKEPAR